MKTNIYSNNRAMSNSEFSTNQIFQSNMYEGLNK